MCYNVKNKQVKQGQFRGLEMGGDLSIWERRACKNNGKKDYKYTLYSDKALSHEDKD